MPVQATSGAASYDAFGGGVPVAPNYIEDVFSTYLYTGNGSTQTITNGIDLAGEGGLVWTKRRDGAAWYHHLGDTVRGAGNILFSNATDANTTGTGAFTAFSSTGFSFDAAQSPSGVNFASWTFRKQPKFFDVVTYTGDGASNRAIAHALGSAPGMIIVKTTSKAQSWIVYHRSLGTGKYLALSSTDASTTDANAFPACDASTFTPTTGAAFGLNENGVTYVAYIFAHNAGGFGLTGTDNVISCGSYTGNGSATGPVIDLGYEPQWVMVKRASAEEGWYLFDTMRGLTVTSDFPLSPNTANAESSAVTLVNPTATGFTLTSSNQAVNASGNTYIYIAIRRGPMKVPTTGTSVFSQIAATVATNTAVTTNFPVDMVYGLVRPGGDHNIIDRLRGISNTSAVSPYLKTESTSAELTANNIYNADNQTGYRFGSYFSGASSIFYSFRRAPGFFDVVCYTGTGSARTVAHNLAAVPELIIVKRRSGTAGWPIYSASTGINKLLFLNLTDAEQGDPSNTYWNNTLPTTSVFSLGSNTVPNLSGGTYVAYLFASCPGVSKVGSYTGNGTTQAIACGFTGGARFVLIKRTDSTGDWYVWDSARGIVAGNDPHLSLNTTAAEVTTDDSVDTDSTGFVVNQVAATNINVSSATYVFLAVA